MKLGIIVQARMGSTRYPGKVLKIMYKDQTLLDLILLNLKSLNHKIIVATTKRAIDNPIIKIAEKHDLSYFCGDENNVLNRYIECAEEFKISHIIRICADNVFIQNEFISNLLDNISTPFEYISYEVNGINSILTQWGLFGEFVTLEALKKVENSTNSSEYLEHVTNYIYTHSNEFHIKYLKAPQTLQRDDIRLTIDTPEDFEICKIIINSLSNKDLDWTYKNIIEVLENNPQLFKKMAKNIKKYRKF